QEEGGPEDGDQAHGQGSSLDRGCPSAFADAMPAHSFSSLLARSFAWALASRRACFSLSLSSRVRGSFFLRSLASRYAACRASLARSRIVRRRLAPAFTGVVFIFDTAARPFAKSCSPSAEPSASSLVISSKSPHRIS